VLVLRKYNSLPLSNLRMNLRKTTQRLLVFTFARHHLSNQQ
jgi:hypothetical protein